jgi:superfamily II DNA or RNA helicase
MATINNYGFILPKSLVNKDLLKKIKNDLTVTPETNFGNIIPNSFKVYSETTITDTLFLPIYYALNLKIPYTVTFKEPEIVYFNSNIVLRESQIACYEKCILEKDKPLGGGIINLGTASGKTLISLKLIDYFKMKTLVIVNKIELVKQWTNEINKFLPGTKIGIIQGSKFDIEDKSIVIGMLQTMSLKETLKAVDFTSFGLSIADEIHNISTEMFSKIMFKVRPKYLFGLTATLERKDKLEKVIKWYVGDIIYSNISSERKQTTEIHVYKYYGKSSVPKTLKDGTAACSSMLSEIAMDNERSDLIVRIIKELIVVPERQILVLSDRTIQLKYIHKKLGPEVSGLFIGSMKSDQLLVSKTKQVLLGTYGICNEGFSLEKLNCLVFGTSRSSTVQAIGRCYRKQHTITPIIVDIVDQFSIFPGQYYRRRKIYKDNIVNPKFIEKSGEVSMQLQESSLEEYSFIE